MIVDEFLAVEQLQRARSVYSKQTGEFSPSLEMLNPIGAFATSQYAANVTLRSWPD